MSHVRENIVEDVYGRITAIMQDLFDDDDIVATPELTADDVDAWDSLAHVTLMLSIEREFKVKFSAAEIASFKNVGDLAKAVTAKAQ